MQTYADSEVYKREIKILLTRLWKEKDDPMWARIYTVIKVLEEHKSKTTTVN